MKKIKKNLSYLIAAVLTAFGLLTLFLTTSVILDLFGMRAREGNYVMFVVVANFISGLLYVISAYGIIQYKKWTVKFLGISLAVLLVAFIGLIIHANTGGIYETETIGAMAFRLILTTVFVVSAYFLLKKKE
ncbi:MAG: hypothetical protein PF484_06790 [Bacteroidales bacterium]|jgi:hypothetical protein|nr:hypothetical protein [Bacteroidales bacterium]